MRLMSVAGTEYDAEDRDSSLRALNAYRRAETIWQELGIKREQAQALYSVAMLEYWAAYDWSRSAAMAAQASAIYRELGFEQLYANALMLQGTALIEAANELGPRDAQATLAAALELFGVAKSTHERLKNEFALAHLSNNVGLTYFYMGDWDRARTLWGDSAQQFQALGDWREELNARQNQAVIDGLQGYNKRAIETLQYIIDSLPNDSDLQFRVNVIDNLAENYRLYGEYEDALQAYSTAHAIHRRIGDGIGEAYALTGIGNTYYSIGELDLAGRYLEQALPLAEESNDGRSQEAILARLGDIKFLQSDYAEALNLHRAALDLAVAEPDRAHRQLSVAKDLAALDRNKEALRLAVEAAELALESSSLSTHADAEMQIGKIEAALGNSLSARSHFESALETYESLGLKHGEADALNSMANAARRRNELDAAIRLGRASIDAIESLRERVAAPELRAHYSAASQHYYEDQIDMLMARAEASPASSAAFTRRALTISESARARLTIDLLREASADPRSRADPALLEAERQLLEELAAKAQQRDRLVRRRAVDETARITITSLDGAMTDLENRLNILRTKLRRSDPAYLYVSPTETITVEDFQDLLAPDSVLLQYELGDKRSFVWVVTRDAVEAIELADRATIEQAALDVLDTLNDPGRNHGALRQLDINLQQLTTYVLSPVIHLMAGKRRVLIAPDGALEYIPFAALPATQESNDKDMVDSYEIVTIPSMSVVAALRARAGTAPEKTIAVFADPIVDASDPRLGNHRAQPVASLPAETLTRSSDSLRRLPSTANEARAIAALVPAEERYVALNFDASRENLKTMNLGNYRYLHFATHGVVDARYPALSSLVLSRFDAKGDPQEGALRLFDILDLELNAELVVLSACDTALGRQIRGEGLIGLAQGFMYAGARSLLVSLWQVPDRATAELMTHFYEYMLDPDAPDAPAAALRKAQLTLAEDRRWRHPYYWGAFVVLGDWQ
jgi:CHAT domain-containing protein